eukprot:scaffold285505_cov31-Tisochrysis_lutea.AAC.1
MVGPVAHGRALHTSSTGGVPVATIVAALFACLCTEICAPECCRRNSIAALLWSYSSRAHAAGTSISISARPCSPDATSPSKTDNPEASRSSVSNSASQSSTSSLFAGSGTMGGVANGAAGLGAAGGRATPLTLAKETVTGLQASSATTRMPPLPPAASTAFFAASLRSRSSSCEGGSGTRMRRE